MKFHKRRNYFSGEMKSEKFQCTFYKISHLSVWTDKFHLFAFILFRRQLF